MILDFLHRAREPGGIRNAVTAETVGLAGVDVTTVATETAALRLAVVNRCLEVISDSIGKMPAYCIDSRTRERMELPVLELLNSRPNEAMTPFVRRKMLELNRLVKGNGYEWILRDPMSMAPVELIPIPAQLVAPWRDTTGRIWYDVSHPYTGEVMRLRAEDVCHYKGYTRDGLKGLGVLERAAAIIGAGTAAQEYQNAYYTNGGQPSGVLQTETDMGGYVKGPDGQATETTLKDALRHEREKGHSGPSNSHRVAILDHGLKYQPIAATMAEAQFVETHDLTVIDICNFFGVPAYKVNAGKQSYSSNEQNAIEYVVSTLQPIVTQMEQEMSWRLLMPRQIQAGLELRLNMMVELRGDFGSRSTWYERMRHLGAYSVNDIRALEDLPDVEGGDEREASLNYVPLSQWAELSTKRAENYRKTSPGGEDE